MIAAKTLAELCKDAYGRADHSIKHSHAITETIERHFVVAVRGTDSRTGWLSNFMVWPVTRFRVNVHLGFYNGGTRLFDAIRPDLAARPVILTGHSKGAAEAVIVAAHLVELGKPPAAVVLFGAPRCGFQGLKSFLSAVRIANYANPDDPVTKIPTILPWCHVREPRMLEDIEGDKMEHGIEKYLVNLPDAPLLDGS